MLATPVEDEAPKMPSPGHSCGSLGLDSGQAGRDVAEDPMMVEVVAAVPIIQIAGAPSEHEAPERQLRLCVVVGRRTRIGRLWIPLGMAPWCPQCSPKWIKRSFKQPVNGKWW